MRNSRFKISSRTICSILVCLVLIIVYIGYQLFVYFMPLDYEYGFLAVRLMSWNLRELGNYPEHQIIYVEPPNRAEGLLNVHTCPSKLEVGVYPYLDDELEKKIRDLGYPFNYFGITYVGTDNYEDISKAHAGYLYIDYGWAEDLIAPDAELTPF